MAYLYRLAVVLLFCLPAFSWSAEYGQRFEGGGWVYQGTSGNGSPLTGWVSAQAACSATAVGYGPDGSGNYRVGVLIGSTEPYGCDMVNTGYNVHTMRALISRYDPPSPTCAPKPPHPGIAGTVTGTQCVCPVGMSVTSFGDACEDPNVKKCADLALSKDNNYTKAGEQTAPTEICQGLGPGKDCTVSVKWDLTYSVNGQKQSSGVGSYDGKTCSQSAIDNAASVPVKPEPVPHGTPGEPAPNPCKTGQFPGEVNGLPVCVDPVDSGPVKEKSTTTTSKPKDDPNEPPEETKVTKETTCVGNVCTTTTTTTINNSSAAPGTPGANGTKTETKDENKNDFCKDNPRSAQCVVGKWGGSCSAGFTCDGDAVQCAIAKETHTRNCQLFSTATPESELYDASKAKTGNVTGDLPGNSSVELGPASFSQAAVIASSELQDFTITVAGSSFTVEMSRLNIWLQMFGFINVAGTALLCARIVIGAA